MITLGITGTLGAGKGEVVSYLVKQKGFVHISVRQFLTRELERRNRAVNRDTMYEMANEFRRQGPGFIINHLLKDAPKERLIVIESLRAVTEIRALKERENAYIFAVTADPHIRYERIMKRKSSTDNVSFEKFISDEQRESTSTNINEANLPQCITNADFVFTNDSSIEQLHVDIENVLKRII
ncbi:AAA family ATPase [Candidatus Parcubacteria bacterium]|nr:AAA family ATPase [Candidatus Parcubacteria bacterium]